MRAFAKMSSLWQCLHELASELCEYDLECSYYLYFGEEYLFVIKHVGRMFLKDGLFLVKLYMAKLSKENTNLKNLAQNKFKLVDFTLTVGFHSLFLQNFAEKK